jgi:hypothetical protein
MKRFGIRGDERTEPEALGLQDGRGRRHRGIVARSGRRLDDILWNGTTPTKVH